MAVEKEIISVVCYLWFDPKGKHNHLYTYGVEHVQMLKRMVDRHLTLPHRFICITDRKSNELPGIQVVPIDKTTHIPKTRFVKLMTFRPDIASVLGTRILQLDLDTVIVNNIDALVDRPEDLVLWRNPNFGGKKRARYNTSIVLYRAGTRPEIWNKFDKSKTPPMLKKYVGGTDQAWISHVCSAKEAHWTNEHGIWGAGRLLDIVPGVKTELPEGARIVFFPGRREPGMAEIQKLHPWIKEHRK